VHHGAPNPTSHKTNREIYQEELVAHVTYIILSTYKYMMLHDVKFNETCAKAAKLAAYFMVEKNRFTGFL